MKKYENFRVWFQKTLPTLYNDALTYEEMLYLLNNRLNELTLNNNDMVDEIESIKNWLNDLNLQDEVNNKLDEMTIDGTLDEIINQNIFNELNEKIDSLENSTSFLNENIKYNFIGGTESSPVGNCCLIQTLNNNIIIDTGEQKDANSLLLFLAQNNINKIDYIFISHYHEDHINGLEALLDSSIDFTSCKAYLPHHNLNWSNMLGDFSKVIGQEQDVINYLDLKNIPIIYPTENETINIDNVIITFYNLAPNYFNIYYNITTDYRDVNINMTNYNNFSMCIKFNFYNKTAFFTGDISYKAMELMSPYILNSSLIQNPHHGLERYIPDNFLANFTPKYNIICGSTFYNKMFLTTPLTALSSNGTNNLIFTTNNTPATTIIFTQFEDWIETMKNPLFNSPASPVTTNSGIMVSLSSNDITDFNEILTPGEYAFQNNTIVSSKLNSPQLGSGIKLIVTKMTPSNTVRQIALSTTNNYEIFATRFYTTDSGWSNWSYINSNPLPLTVMAGSHNTGNVPANSRGEISVSFPRAFNSVPSVVATMNLNYSNIPGVANITLTVINISTTGFTALFYNNTNTSITPSFTWQATPY